MGFFDPSLDAWQLFLFIIFVFGAIFFWQFTIAILSALIAIAVLGVIIVAIYYIGVRVHRRLIGTQTQKKVIKSEGGGGDGP
jgi:hypothetical protein